MKHALAILSLLLAVCLAPQVSRADGEGAQALGDAFRLYRELTARLELQQNQELRQPGLGRAKVIAIAGASAIRVIHERTGLEFLFMDPDRISPESPELRKQLAHEHLDSGGGDIVPRNGRDVVYVWSKSERIESTQEQPRHRFLTSGWWKDFQLATLEKPTAGDVVLGSACGLVYGSLALCTAGAVHALDPSVGLHWEPAAFTAAWSAIQGSYVKFFSNMMYRGTPRRQRIRQFAISLAFNYTITVLTQGVAHMLTIHDPGAQLAHLQTLGLVAINAYISVDLRAIPDIRRELGLNTRPIELELPNGKVIEVDRVGAERNSIGIFTFPVGIFDTMSGGVALGSSGIQIPAGKLAILLSVPFLRRAALWYAEKNAEPGSRIAELRRERWEAWFPLRVWNGLRETQRPLQADACGRFLMPRDAAF